MPSRKLSVVDAGLMASARAGDRASIQTVCALAEDHLREALRELSDEGGELAAYVLDALEQIAGGAAPDAAFGWKRGRGAPKRSTSLRDFHIRMEVRELLRNGESLNGAADAVFVELESNAPSGMVPAVDVSSIKKLCKGLRADSVVHPPSSYPLGELDLYKPRAQGGAPNRDLAG